MEGGRGRIHLRRHLPALLAWLSCGLAAALLAARQPDPRPSPREVLARLGALVRSEAWFSAALPVLGRVQAASEAPADISEGTSWRGPLSPSGALRSVRRRKPASPTEATAAALAELADGRHDEAVECFRQAVESWPQDAALQADLAAAYLSLPPTAGDGLAALRAAEASLAALELDPASPQAKFNLALALERLPLEDETARTWRAFVAEFAASPGGDAAVAHLARLDAAIAARPGPDGASAAWETLVDSALPTVGETGPEPALALARSLADATGDPAPAALAQELAGEGRQQSDRRLDRQLGYRLFGVARTYHRGTDWAAAERTYREAVSTLSAAASALEPLARIYHGVALSWVGHHAAALAELDAAAALPLTTQSSLYQGLLAWSAGWMLGKAGQPGEAAAAYRRATRAFEAGGQKASAAFGYFLTGDLSANLGNDAAAWRELALALARLGDVHEAARAESIYRTAAQVARRLGCPRVSALLQRLQVEAGLRSGIPAYAAEALVGRAEGRQANGDQNGAEADLEAALAAADNVKDPQTRSLLGAQIDQAQAARWMVSDPQAARMALSRVIRTLAEDEERRLPWLDAVLARARLELAGQDLDAADSDLHTALDSLDHLAEGAWDPSHYQASLQRRAVVADLLVDLHLNGRGDSAAAFEAAERVRGRELLGQVPWHRGGELPPPLTVAEVGRRLEPGTTLVYYTLLDHGWVAWVIGQGRYEVVRGAGERAELAAGVEGFVADLARWGWTRTTHQQAAALFDRYVLPLKAALPPSGRLLVVPDEFLWGLPFAALLDTQTGRFVVEDYTLSTTPSVELALEQAERRSGPLLSPDPSVLLVGDPAFDPYLFPKLDRLQDAKGEVEDIASLYPRAELLTGAAATTRNFLRLAADAEVIHIAAHGLLLRENPLLSSFALAVEPGTEGSSPLTASQLYRSTFPSTRLVVLSACEAGVGPSLGGEGPLSLARPFLAAGVPAVVASLWSLGDEATKPLMVKFHELLRQGYEPAEALAEMQREEVRKEREEGVKRGGWAGFAMLR